MTSFLISILAAFGLTIALFEKSSEPPVIYFVEPLRGFMEKISPTMAKVWECPVCLSFWCGIIFYLLIRWSPEVFLPIGCGFASLGVVWFAYQVLESRK